MKKFYLLIAALMIVAMTSMMLTEKNVSQETTLPTMGESQPMFLKGMITIKVKEGVGEFDVQKDLVSFNIPSLDVKEASIRLIFLKRDSNTILKS